MEHWLAAWAVEYYSEGAVSTFAESLMISLLQWVAAFIEWLFDPGRMITRADGVLQFIFELIQSKLPAGQTWASDIADFFNSDPLTNLWDVVIYFGDMFVPATILHFVLGAIIAQYLCVVTVRIVMWILGLVWVNTA